MIPRKLLAHLHQRLTFQPAVALLGPRQVGKTTLAQRIATEYPDSILLDLERVADRARLTEPALFLSQHRDQLVILDEVQTLPDLFVALRPEIDADRRSGRFLLLGSASGKLLKQTSESLAGRVSYLELTPFLLNELVQPAHDWQKLWLRGGFPPSFTAPDDNTSLLWRSDLIQTFLARDIPQAGITIPAETLRRFWRMCAHSHGQLLNLSQFGSAMGGVSHTTIARYLDILVDCMMIRRLEPLHANLSKRLIKSPKIYLRDSGLLHALLSIPSFDDLLANPVVGHSWEGFVIEQIAASLPPLAEMNFYRTAAGAELDVVVRIGSQRIAYEIKFSQTPKPTRGFWNACEDLGIQKAYVVAPINDGYPLAANVEVISPRMIGQSQKL